MLIHGRIGFALNITVLCIIAGVFTALIFAGVIYPGRNTKSEESMEYKVNNLIYAAGKDLHNTIRSKVTLTEPIHADALRKAADEAVTRYPYFSVKLERRGEEYVMTENNAPLRITPNGKTVTLGSAESAYHLLALAYDSDSVYIDTSHFLTDGNGIFPFIKTLLYCYLHQLHPDEQFDTDSINLPCSEIPDEESDDYPFPEKPLNAEPFGSFKRPDNVFFTDDQPSGYSSREQWTSFCIKIPQKDMMRFASGVDGSPATFIASMLYRTISDLHPENRLPIVCGMQHQYRKALGKPFSHNCHVNIVPIVYTDKMRGRNLGFLNTMARGTVIIRADNENDKLSVNTHISNEKLMKGMRLEQKRVHMRKELIKHIGQNTFEVSYTGRVPFSGLDKYISNFVPFLDMSLSGDLSAEIFAFKDVFSINIMQRSDDDKYFKHFVEILTEYHIECEFDAPSYFEIPDFELPR